MTAYVEVTKFRLARRAGEQPHSFVDIDVYDGAAHRPKRRVQVVVSPTGRRVRVFIDGQEATT